MPHIRSRGEEANGFLTDLGYRARRWVVERVHSWINRYPSLLVRWSKKPENHGALMKSCRIHARQSHAARDSPADRMLADARLPSAAQIDALAQRRSGYQSSPIAACISNATKTTCDHPRELDTRPGCVGPHGEWQRRRIRRCVSGPVRLGIGTA